MNLPPYISHILFECQSAATNSEIEEVRWMIKHGRAHVDRRERAQPNHWLKRFFVFVGSVLSLLLST